MMQHDGDKHAFGLALLASAQIAIAMIVFGWMGLLLIVWFFYTGFSPSPEPDMGLDAMLPHFLMALVALPAITALFAVVSALGYFARSRYYGLHMGHVFVVTFLLALVAIARGWQHEATVLWSGVIISCAVLGMLDFRYRRCFRAGSQTAGGKVRIWVNMAGLACLYSIAVLAGGVFARSLYVPTIAEVTRENHELYACITNMEKIDEAKDAVMRDNDGRYSAGDRIPEDLVNAKVKGGLGALECPKGGRYTINGALRQPECSVHGSEGAATQRMKSL